MKKIILTENECKYLMNDLLKNRQDLRNKIEASREKSSIIFIVDEDTANEIRELAGDEVGLHFDKNYEPTKEGKMLEDFIDKFYFE